MSPQEIAQLIEARLGRGSKVVVTREGGGSFDMRIEVTGRTYFRSVVSDTPESLDAALAEQIAASVPD